MFEVLDNYKGSEVGIAAIIALLVTVTFAYVTKSGGAVQLVNPSVKKDQEKVVDSFTLIDLEDLCKKSGKDMVALCRCWRSSNFPFCDGTHTKYNKQCKDNTGPLLIKKK